MSWVGDLLTNAGPWTGWVIAGLMVAGSMWALINERLIAIDRHKRELEEERKRTAQVVRQLELRLEDEQERTAGVTRQMEFWREAALTTSEMGKILTEIKAVERRDQ